MLKKVSNMPLTLKATLVFAIASFATSGINYITTPIFTRLLTTTEYGIVQVYNSWYSILQVFASMTLIFPGILNVGLHDHSENRWKYLSSMLGITSLSTFCLALIYLLTWQQTNTLLRLPTSLIVLMLLTCFFQPATTFWTFKQRYEFNYRVTFAVSVGSAILAQIVAVAVVIYASKNTGANMAVARLWSAGVVNLMVALVLYIQICRKGKNFIDLSLWRTTILVAIPLIPHYLSSVVLNSTDKLMISRMVGDDKTGIYSLAAILSAIGVLVWRALSVTFTPFINTKLAQRNFQQIRTAVKPLLVVVGTFCILAALAAPEIIRLLATKEYLEGIYVVPPIAAGIYIHALYDNFTAISFFHKKSVQIMLATLTAAILNILLNYVFISRFGYLAAGYTTLISNLVLTGLHYLNARRIEKEKVFDERFSLASVVIVTVACLMSNLFYPYMLIRYMLIVALLAFLVTQRKKIVDTIVAMK